MMSEGREKTSNANGRKYCIVKWLIFLWFLCFGNITYLSHMNKRVPQSIGLTIVTITSGIVGYIGVNVWQKKIQSGSGNGKPPAINTGMEV